MKCKNAGRNDRARRKRASMEEMVSAVYGSFAGGAPEQACFISVVMRNPTPRKFCTFETGSVSSPGRSPIGWNVHRAIAG